MTKSITIGVRLHIKLSDIADLLDSASRGALYWCDNALGYESEVALALSDKGVTVTDNEDGDKDYTLNLAKIKKGLTVMAKLEPEHFADFITDNADQVTGDVFLQCCLLGRVVYS